MAKVKTENEQFLKGLALAASAILAGKRKPQREAGIDALLPRIRNRGISKEQFLAAIEAADKTASRKRKAKGA